MRTVTIQESLLSPGRWWLLVNGEAVHVTNSEDAAERLAADLRASFEKYSYDDDQCSGVDGCRDDD